MVKNLKWNKLIICFKVFTKTKKISIPNIHFHTTNYFFMVVGSELIIKIIDFLKNNFFIKCLIGSFFILVILYVIEFVFSEKQNNQATQEGLAEYFVILLLSALSAYYIINAIFTIFPSLQQTFLEVGARIVEIRTARRELWDLQKIISDSFVRNVPSESYAQVLRAKQETLRLAKENAKFYGDDFPFYTSMRFAICLLLAVFKVWKYLYFKFLNQVLDLFKVDFSKNFVVKLNKVYIKTKKFFSKLCFVVFLVIFFYKQPKKNNSLQNNIQAHNKKSQAGLTIGAVAFVGFVTIIGVAFILWVV